VTPARPVLFDMDGTLTDSLAIITACFDRTMREEAGVVHEPAFYRRFIGPPLHDSFAELGVADPARFVAEYRRRYAETMLDTPLFPGVRELLERLDAAGVPMLPVVRTPVQVTSQIVWYTVATVITPLFLIPAAGMVYAITAVATGVWFLTTAIVLHRGVKNGGKVKPLKLFILSNNYLALLFVGLSIDAVMGLPTLGAYL